jgi:hypothetical protein
MKLNDRNKSLGIALALIAAAQGLAATASAASIGEDGMATAYNGLITSVKTQVAAQVSAGRKPAAPSSTRGFDTSHYHRFYNTDQQPGHILQEDDDIGCWGSKDGAYYEVVVTYHQIDQTAGLTNGDYRQFGTLSVYSSSEPTTGYKKIASERDELLPGAVYRTHSLALTANDAASRSSWDIDTRDHAAALFKETADLVSSSPAVPSMKLDCDYIDYD